jgi:hypothetical protein
MTISAQVCENCGSGSGWVTLVAVAVALSRQWLSYVAQVWQWLNRLLTTQSITHTLNTPLLIN